MGNNIEPAKKKRIKPKVKGGILVSASLNIGEAAPKIIFTIIMGRRLHSHKEEQGLHT